MPAIDYHHTFKALDSLLDALKPLWQLVAFECDHLPWQQTFPQLAQQVWLLDDAEIDSLDASQQQLVDTLLPSLISDIQHNQWPYADELISRLSLLVITSATGSIDYNNAQWLSANKSQRSDPKSDDATNDNLINNHQQKNQTENDDLAHFSAHIKGRKCSSS
jgi:hypothetical protein